MKSRMSYEGQFPMRRSVEICHICEKPCYHEDIVLICDGEVQLAICEYCYAEQLIINEDDEEAQEDGLDWAAGILASIKLE